MPAQIAIERLKICTIIHRADAFDFGPFGSFAEVQDIEFDGYGYTVTARLIVGDEGAVSDTDVEFIVDAGHSVAFGGLGEPSLRAEDDVTDEEWEAKGEAISADIDRIQGMINEHRRQPAPVTLEAATASFCDMLVSRNVNAPALIAAE